MSEFGFQPEDSGCVKVRLPVLTGGEALVKHQVTIDGVEKSILFAPLQSPNLGDELEDESASELALAG